MPSISQDPTDLELLKLRAASNGEDQGFEAGDPRTSPAGFGERRGASLVYLVSPEVSHQSDVAIHASDEPVPAWLRAANPGNWEPVEWDELLDGRLGPWAIAVDDRRVLSICHTPLPMSERAAEVGVWTAPLVRGRGYAAAVTAAWARVLRPSGRYLFYSSLVANRSSQRVVERLGARLIGWTWQIGEGGDESASHVHPLSSLR